MDEERKLVTELQGKLAQLDQKVWQYGKDMAAEFERYKERVLKDVPKELSETVSKTIATSMKNYKGLYPVEADENESESTSSSTIRADDHHNNDLPAFYSRPQPIAFRPSTLQPADDSQHSRSPHARDEEFMGIITPLYLPLLEDSRKERRESDERRVGLERRRSSDSGQPSPAHLQRSETVVESVDASTSTRSLSATPEPPRPSVPIRKNTDEASVVSAASDHSESTYPRSALRRASNSSTRASPRRVRFDFEGTEVLPTSSPLPAPTPMAEGIYDSDDDEPGSQQVEDIEEEDSPPPKRISSSQKLRALSRRPLEDDDNTVWTPVSAPDDGSPSVETDGAADSFASGITTEGPAPPLPPRTYNTQLPSSVSDYISNLPDDDLALDEDMPEYSSLKGRTPIFPANILSPEPKDSDSPASPSRTPRPTWKAMHTVDEDSADVGPGMRFGQDDQDELFDFDEDTSQRSPPEELQDDSSDKDNSSEPPSPTFKTEPNPLFGRSPARPIFRPTDPQPSQATASLATSFKMNHPFSMPIVSEEMHAQAASMGPVNSFVGSVNGRSGLDESNVASYRATGGFGSFAGGQSMTERMYMDDWNDEQATLKSRSKN